jgi:hypothetical protein
MQSTKLQDILCIVAEILEIAGKTCTREGDETTITARHVTLGVTMDEELNQLFVGIYTNQYLRRT